MSGAVGILVDLPSEWEKPSVPAEMDATAPECLHVSLGPYIRKRHGLWGDNAALLEDCGTEHADEAHAAIMNALVRRLKRTGNTASRR